MLSDFSSYFEIMAVLNLGYAGSEYFRRTVNQEILKLSKFYSPAIEGNIRSIESKIIVLEGINGDSFPDEIQNGATFDSAILKSIRQKFTKGKTEIEALASSSESVTRAFKSMFLITSLYCFFILILGGFESYIGREAFVDYLLYCGHVVLIYDCVILIRSFIPKYKANNIKPIFTFSVFLALILLGIGYCLILQPSTAILKEEFNISIAIVIATLSYVFHFARAWLSKRHLDNKYRKLFQGVKKQLEDIEEVLDELDE